MATLTKYRKGLVLLIFVPLLLFVAPNSAFAKMVTFERGYTYQASEADSKLSSRTIALEQVKRLLLEQLGTYLESQTEVKDFKLTKDQIITLTAGIVRTEIIDEKWDGKTYHLKAKITADPDEVLRSLDALRKDRERSKELEETKKKAEEALKEVERLKKEFEMGKKDKGKQKEYTKAVNKLSSKDWFEKGLSYRIYGKYNDAVDALSKAIDLDPDFSEAYLQRGWAYQMLALYFPVGEGRKGKQTQALLDFDKAIELNPKYIGAYYLRAETYAWKKKYPEAIRNYNIAIELDPSAFIYNARGSLYEHLGNYQQAIKDYSKSIELDPAFAASYFRRGVAYNSLNNHRQAIQDFDIAIKLSYFPEWDAYLERGKTYSYLFDYHKAIKDYNSAIEEFPYIRHTGNYKAYHLRANAYLALGNYNQAIRDFNKAIEAPSYLPPKDHKEHEAGADVVYLHRGLAYYNLKKYFEAFRDLDKAIELNPQAGTYHIRATCHEALGHYPQAISDYKDAARLGAIGAQDYLRSKGIQW